ncbi:Argininosuccinate lyase (plasmid) [Variovorax sp. SRS16]|uniref:Bug family tripartite tricarboxylate transporter substrate binding protein n=1 Tax=Variovorax sp. SRS16 TaxID=282217 RepID=UPI001317A8D6|nr:tripartite tricarboxylate transporter substrate binding protein [Variovorax sp. SRS16]VTU45731.1 Argininosuccinate lyase [Variovorax sp. SRS16]
MNTLLFLRATALLAAAAIAAPAFAQDAYPAKPIVYVVPNAPGGSGDVIARTLSGLLSRDLGVPVVIENKAGATGVIGAQFVARSKPDGYTLLVSSTGPMAVVPGLRSDLPYDANDAFLPVIKIAESHTVLVVPAAKPWHSVKEIVQAAKAAPGTMSFASGGNGTVLHLQGELFKLKTSIDMVHVPYKGDAPAVTDLLAGQVSMMFVPTQSVAPQVQAGLLRVIATTSSKRLPSMPDVPTMAEAGVPDFAGDAWFGAYVPAKTPASVVVRLNAAFNKILKDPTVIDRLQKLGLTVAGGDAASLMTAQRADMKRWAEVIKAANVHMSE